ncbi:MAG: primosomal protein N' [Clostridiales bacterium]|nr:primosomal protein N' [Clostridiales bacterium]
MIASVVLRECVRRTDRMFDYIVPEELEDSICPGQYVRVPFGGGNRIETALVLDVRAQSDYSEKLKAVIEIIDKIPVLHEDQMQLIRYVRTRYTCTHGDAIRLMVPSFVTERKEKTHQVVCVSDEAKAISVLAENELNSLAQIRVLEMVLESNEVPVSEILNALSISRSPITSLRKKGLISIMNRKACASPSGDEEDDRWAQETQFPTLSDHQRKAVDAILSDDIPNESLLFGVTGSGKTEVYLRCAQKIVSGGGSVIFLVPEISLTPQMIRWVRERFPDGLAVLHSRLTPKERYEQWDMIRKGEARIVIGARSAIFAPLTDLQLILVDEEQDTSYKSETHPRYHARDIARMRSRITGAKLVFGSATPAVETYYSATQGYTKRLLLPDRVKDAVMPKVHIVDMREELIGGNRSILSRQLKSEMSRAFKKGEQAILFLNKRGYSSFVLCRACGHTILCPHCSVAMTLHAPGRGRKPIMICHYCMYAQNVPKTCPECNSSLQGRIGMGTQQLEEAVRSEFPDRQVIRMDQDTTAGKDAHARLLNAFRKKEADILLGTQMIAKGHDFPDVTVVGIISADLLLRASDFRAGERAFQLITQASGRAGRADKPGNVYIQTYSPEDEMVTCAASNDYEAFFEKELEYRKRLGYPPFLAFGSLVLSSKEEKTGHDQIRMVKEHLDLCVAKFPDVSIRVFGPGPALMYKLRDRYRFQINIKAPNKSMLSSLFHSVQERFSGMDYAMHMDIDPLW